MSSSAVLANVEWKLVEMPLPRLQRVGNSVVPFLYRIAWDEHIRRTDYATGAIPAALELQDRAADHLVRLAGLIRPLVQRLWAARVAHYNRRIVKDAGLDDFLFAAQRLTTVRLRLALTELQHGRCFYTGESLEVPGEIDHFLPWARYPNDAIENLVVASRRANADKRAFLVAPEHLERWRQRNDEQHRELTSVASAAHWETRSEETSSVARAIYLRLPDGVELWVRGKLFVPARHEHLLAALAS